VNVDDNTKPSVQQKKRGTRSQHKHNDYLMEALKEEVDKCSPKEGDHDVESGCISDSGLQHLKNICEILFKKKREFSSVHQLCQFAARLGSKWYFQVSRDGYKVTCHYAPPKKVHASKPGRQRKIKECRCTQTPVQLASREELDSQEGQALAQRSLSWGTVCRVTSSAGVCQHTSQRLQNSPGTSRRLQSDSWLLLVLRRTSRKLPNTTVTSRRMLCCNQAMNPYLDDVSM
jgi:hypothetical protein